MKGMFQKRFIAVVTALTLFCSMFVTYGSASAEANNALNIEAEAAILVEANSGKILYQKNPDASLPIASMTKMMSEYLVHEAVEKGKIKWDQKTTVSPYAHGISQNRDLSNVPLENGGSYTVKELYEAMAIYSANGATIALAELIAGSEANFVKKMNEKAKELGLKNSSFVNSTGLSNSDLNGQHPEGTNPDEENKMSARDSALLAQRLIKDYPEILETAKIPKKTFQEDGEYPVKMDNWNWMLKGLVMEYEGVDGLKTGSTPAAGSCFTGTAKRDDMRLISVVIKTESHTARFTETKKLFDYGFTNFETKKVYDKGAQVKEHKTVHVDKAKDTDVAVKTEEEIVLPMPKGSKDVYKTEFKESKQKEAPVKKGTELGYMMVSAKDSNDPGFLTGKSLQVDLVTTAEVEKANWFTLSMRGIGGFFSGLWNSAVDTVTGWF